MTTKRRLGKTELSVSQLGFGTYRTVLDHPEHEKALRLALSQGINLIDTSTNYGDGRSEALVGHVLSTLSPGLSREDIVVVTKAGYVQGQNLKLAREREAQGQAFPEMVKYQDHCWHCIHPTFLEDQITRSLDRLKLKTIDVLLLHNPEYFLKTNPDHTEYYRRIENAFKHLELEVERGRIRYYGISSNTFPDPRESEDFTSLEIVHQLACGISPQHHFAVIQLPLNLYESGAVFENNNSYSTVLELAERLGLGVLINRPLNAFYKYMLLRLADVPPRNEGHERKALLRVLETAMTAEMQTNTNRTAESVDSAYSTRDWAHVIRQNLNHLKDQSTWREFRDETLLPSLRTGKYPSEYQNAMEALIRQMTLWTESVPSQRVESLKQHLDQEVPALRSSRTLAQKATRVLNSLPGVTSVLVGMRSEKYVEELSEELCEDQAPLSREDAFNAFDVPPIVEQELVEEHQCGCSSC